MTVHRFDTEDLDAVKQVLDTGQLCSINGQFSRRFEQAFAREIGVRRAVAVNSGMSALHCAVYAAGAGAGDEVICDSMVQFGSMAVIYNNAVPVFADVDPDTFLIDPESVRKRITERTKAIVCTHFCGLPCDMDAIMRIAKEHNLAVIEDNAHGLFAEYKGRLTGTLGHMAEFSFQMSKQLGLGDGGMATATDERFVEGLVDGSGIRGLATFPKMMWNYRMNEVVAAIGLVQLGRARRYVEDGIANANLYTEAVRGAKLVVPQREPADRKNAHHLWGAQYVGEKHGVPLSRFKETLKKAGCGVGVGYIGKAPYLHDTYTVPLTYGRGCPFACPLQARKTTYAPGLCPTAEDLMPRLILTGTNGTRDVHRANADKLRAAIDQLERVGA